MGLKERITETKRVLTNEYPHDGSIELEAILENQLAIMEALERMVAVVAAANSHVHDWYLGACVHCGVHAQSYTATKESPNE